MSVISKTTGAVSGSSAPSVQDPNEPARLDEQYERFFARWVGFHLREAGVLEVADLGCAGGASLPTLKDAGVKIVSGFDEHEGPLARFAQRARDLGLAVRETRVGRFDGMPARAECCHFTCVAMHAGTETMMKMCSSAQYIVLGESDFHEATTEGATSLDLAVQRIRALSPNGRAIRPRLLEGLKSIRATIDDEVYETLHFDGMDILSTLRFLEYVSPSDWAALRDDPRLGHARLSLPFVKIFARREAP